MIQFLEYRLPGAQVIKTSQGILGHGTLECQPRVRVISRTLTARLLDLELRFYLRQVVSGGGGAGVLGYPGQLAR